MTASAKISARILAAMANGATLPQAIDAVLGAGTFATVADDVYDTLRAEG